MKNQENLMNQPWVQALAGTAISTLISRVRKPNSLLLATTVIGGGLWLMKYLRNKESEG